MITAFIIKPMPKKLVTDNAKTSDRQYYYFLLTKCFRFMSASPLTYTLPKIGFIIRKTQDIAGNMRPIKNITLNSSNGFYIHCAVTGGSLDHLAARKQEVPGDRGYHWDHERAYQLTMLNTLRSTPS